MRDLCEFLTLTNDIDAMLDYREITKFSRHEIRNMYYMNLGPK